MNIMKIDWDKAGPCCSCVNGIPTNQGTANYQKIKCKLDGKKRPEHMVRHCWQPKSKEQK